MTPLTGYLEEKLPTFVYQLTVFDDYGQTLDKVPIKSVDQSEIENLIDEHLAKHFPDEDVNTDIQLIAVSTEED